MKGRQLRLGKLQMGFEKHSTEKVAQFYGFSVSAFLSIFDLRTRFLDCVVDVIGFYSIKFEWATLFFDSIFDSQFESKRDAKESFRIRFSFSHFQLQIYLRIGSLFEAFSEFCSSLPLQCAELDSAA